MVLPPGPHVNVSDRSGLDGNDRNRDLDLDLDLDLDRVM